MKIGFASADWSQTVFDDRGHPVWGGSGFIRIGQYLDLLDLPVVAGSLIHKDDAFGVRSWDGTFHLDCDIVVMQRIMIDDVAEKMAPARAAGQVVINDLDDWYWGLSTANQAFHGTHPTTNPNENINHYRTILARSNAVMTSTPYLAERIASFARCPIEVIPNHVDIRRFTVREQANTTTPVVGWVGSTAHRSGDLEILRGILGPMLRDGQIRLHHSGWHPNHPSFADAVGITGDHCTALPMCAPEHYPELLRFDIGIAPLADVPFNRAKSAIKLLEYSAAGLPVVASDVEPYRRLHDEYGIGRLARKPVQWRKHLEALRDPDLRRSEGAANRERVAPLDIVHGAKLLRDYLVSWA